MSLVYTQPFIKVIREIQGIEQKYIETELDICLYETKIVTPTKTFFLKDVFDISYRCTTKKYGTLYLHTNQGVFPFSVCNNPEHFIKLVKSLRDVN